MANRRKLKRNIQKFVGFTIILLIIVLTGGIFFLKKFYNQNKPISTEWVNTYYQYLTKNINDDISKINISFYDLNNQDPVMITEYQKDNLNYTSLYHIENKNVKLIEESTGIIEPLYNIKENSYDYYYHTSTVDSDTYIKINDLINQEGDTYQYQKNDKDSVIDINGNEISILKFDQELIKIEKELNKIEYEPSSSQKELKKKLENYKNGYNSNQELITDKNKELVNEKINMINSKKEDMQKALHEIKQKEEEKKKQEEEAKKKEDEKKKEESKYATSVAVLNYHFFYDKKTEKCDETICIDIENFEKQLKYLKDNGYKTLTINEFKQWMYKEIELPKKSVLITIDDGAMGTSKINGNKLIPLLEKYQVHATLFLITGWWDVQNYQSNYLDVESHSHLMHEEGVCSNKSRGAKMLCSTKEEIKADLEKSIQELDSNTAFCFPFYLSDNKSIEVLKELNFKIAFVGGDEKATRNSNKYKIPRYVIYKNTSLNSFKNMIS